MTRVRWMRISRLMAFLAIIPMVLPCGTSLRAADPARSASGKTGKAAPTTGTKASPECHLSFLRKPWPEVLQKVADDTHSTLVMPVEPPGVFSRTDFGKHSREDAVRILNRDLEKAGFRLVENNEKLEVISIERKQPEYERHTVQPNRKPASSMEAPVELSSDASTNARAIQRVNHEAAESRPAPVVSSSTIKPTSRPALEIAKQIHQTFKQRSRLENSGPHGLPAFVVEHFKEDAVEAKLPLFVLEIDTNNNELILTAEEPVQAGLKQLIQKVDLNPLGNETLPKLMAGNGTTADTGRKLVQPLSLIAQVREEGNPAAKPLLEETNDLVPSDAAPIAPPAPPAGNEPAAGGIASGGLPALLGNLKGDVAIESLNDLDLLILRGNEKDVESVMQVIRAIEQMAMGSLPEVHLLRLRFVDSQSMAQLLNDVYTRMTELRANNAQQSQVAVRVVPVVTPNAVLILASSNAIEAVLQLADELDQAIDPTHEVQIFRLKHAVASSVVEMLTSFYTQPPVGLGTRLKTAADPRTNSVVVQANPRDMSEIAEFIKGLDNEQAASTSRMRIFPLKSAGAEDLAAFLNNALQSALNPPRMMTSTTGQQQQQQVGTNTATQQARATVLEFLAEGGQELIRSGLLNEIRFNADPRTNSLLVTASEQSMPLVEELIRMLDRPSSALAEIKVFTLKNADAVNAVALLDQLFNASQSQNAGQGSQGNSLGMELLGTQGSGSSLIPLRFSTDARTNSVVAIGGADALRIVEAILYKLDTNNARNRQTTVIKLRNSPVADVAAAINEFLAAQRELATIDPDRISTSQLLEQEIIVTAEPITNSLLISATPTYFKQLEEIAKRLDAEPAQVVIQAMMVEVVLDNVDEFGVELGFQDPVLFARSAIADLVTTTTTTAVPGVGNVQTTNIVSQSATPGFNFNNQPLGNNNSASNPQTVGAQGLSNFAMGRTSNELGYGGLVLSASSDAVSVLIRALAARRTLRVLSRPQVLALDNQQAQIQVGQVVPVPDGTTLSSTGLSQVNVLRDPAGIILTVSPRISPEGQIVMEVAAEKSAYPDLNSGVAIANDGNGNIVYAPVKDITTARTTVKVPDGQTIVVGGMITKNDQAEERKIPWLGDLPMVGKLFRYDSFQFRRTELLIFLTPRIVHGDADMEQIKQIEAGRLHFFQDDVESLHGPIFGVPPDMTYPLDSLPPVDATSPSSLPAPRSGNPQGPPPLPPAPVPNTINPTSGVKPLNVSTKQPAVTRLGEVTTP
ncbi:secretin N-terminal domain-containing protein [Planctomicrobium sp. SH661]|uniref:secretin N-terminal domain-containing protein n=1 Tax=Planctomicrobium sp. SH661 TaxID=3448124 RepID=UPI003F5BEA26